MRMLHIIRVRSVCYGEKQKFDCLLDSMCLLVLGLFLTMFWVGLRCVIVVFPGQIFLLFKPLTLFRIKKNYSICVLYAFSFR